MSRATAHAAGLGEIDLDIRDVDVPLSELGTSSPRRWANGSPPCRETSGRRWSSPRTYLRARQTAQRSPRPAASRGRSAFCVDERLREREFGILDRLTTAGIESRSPSRPRRGAGSANSTIGRPAARAGAT